MTIKHGLSLPQGSTLELAGFQEPTQAWQALTSFARAADAGVPPRRCLYLQEGRS